MLAAISKHLVLPVWPVRTRRKSFLARMNSWLTPDHSPTVTYVGNNRVLVGINVGGKKIAYLVEADDRLLSPWFIVSGAFETDLSNFFLRNLAPDSRAIDVGCNFGYFTCLIARHCPTGQVIGIEADRKVAKLARDNIAINGFQGIADIVCAAASDNADGLTLYRRTYRSGNTSIVDVGDALTSQLGEPPAQPFRVPSIRIDDLADRLKGRIDFLKIDVEGAEPLVLAGAKETIARNRQIAIVMEWSPGQIAAAGFNLAGFTAEIAALGLRCFALDRDREHPIDHDMLAAMPYQPGIVLRRAD